ncbi:TRAP transporter large permease [Aquibium sp. LZ166]|uniref:TRAP transporter large permease n=1 Tax=Aquibium pacificus TaxID=3153579 RepID=A0ABV3SGP2_9HYPH
MDPTLFAFVAFIAILGLIAFGIPVALSIMTVTLVGMYALIGDAFVLGTVRTITFSVSSGYSFAIIPMFILMGEIAGGTRIISDLYQACYRFIGGFRGGVYNATVLASAGFAAISGSTIVNSAIFTRVALPEIERLGYHRGFGVGCIAASGALAAMIPPSLTMVLYGILTETSIGAMLIAGILPGLLTAAVLILTVTVSVRLRPSLAPVSSERFTAREKFAGLLDIWPAALLILIVLGGIYTGLMSPSAAGAVGAVGAFLIALLKRRMTWPLFVSSLKKTATIAASIFLILVAGMLFSRLLLFYGSVSELTDVLTAGGFTPFTFMACVVIGYFIFGMFMDPVPMLVITLPFLFPTVLALDINPIWFGIIVVKLIEIAAITPPIGINLFAVVAASDGRVSASELFKGVQPFVIAELLVLALLLAFPSICTFLPGQMMGR